MLTSLASAESRIGFVYYDVGRLYDTIPSPHYDDSRYTPKGKNHWGSERYRRKVENITAVIDSLHMPIVALFGVESEEVVRDIITCSSQDYSYIHRTLDYYDGLDFALLYFGDILFVDYVRSGRTWLYIAGELDDKRIDIHLTRRGKDLRSVTPLIPNREAEITIAAGDLTTADIKRLGLRSPMQRVESRGYGTTRGERGWWFDSRIGVDFEAEGFVYITEWLLLNSRTKPIPTFDRALYLGGYSPHLPMVLPL